MKKKSFYANVAVLVFAATFTSCSSDEVLSNSISLPDGTPAQVTLDCENGLMSLPVEASGDWTAKVVYDGGSRADDSGQIDWLGLVTESGNGNATIDYVVDSNNSSDVRSATIVLTSGDKTVEYKVMQQPVGYGEDNDEIDMSMFGKQIPLGYGIRMQKPDGGDKPNNILLNQVVTLNRLSGKSKRIQDLIEKFGLSPSDYYSVDSTAEESSTLVSKASVEASMREILANLKVTVAYGMFKLNLNGNFRMFGSSDDQNYNFSAMAAPKKGEVQIEQGALNFDLASLEDMDGDDAKTTNDKAFARMLILSNNFLKLRDSIEYYVAKGQIYKKGETNDLYNQIRRLDNAFGPAYITRAEMGGTAELNYLVSKREGADTLKIHGDLTFGLNALLKLDVSASADYENAMKSYLKECSFNYRIKGGSTKEIGRFKTNIAKLMKEDAEIDLATMQETISDWSNSLTFGNATCVSYGPEPIWNLFSDEAAEQLMHYFWDRYPNNGDACPWTYDVRHIITEVHGEFKDPNK